MQSNKPQTINKIILPALLAGVIMLAESLILSIVLSTIFPSVSVEYQNPELFRKWSDPAFYLMSLHPILIGFILTIVWQKLKSNFHSSLSFGIWFWVITFLPGMLISYGSFQVSFLMILTWSINSFIQTLTGSSILSNIDKKGKATYVRL